MEHFAEARDLVRSFGIELVERLNAVFIQTLLFEEDVCEDHVLRIPLVDCPNETRCERCFRRSSRTDEKPERTRGNHGFELLPLLGGRSLVAHLPSPMSCIRFTRFWRFALREPPDIHASHVSTSRYTSVMTY